MVTEVAGRGGAGAWLQAIRPRTLPAAIAPVVVGAAMAGRWEVFSLGPAAAALVCALLIQVATNLANDYFDFLKGGDTEHRVGPTRVVQAGLLSPTAVWRATVLVLVAATGVGIYLVWMGGWPILVVGLLALVCAVAYTGGPFPLAYHGLGDVFAFVFFGPVAVAGTVWVQGRFFHPEFLLAGAGVGALVTAILVVNNLRDRTTDAQAGKRTTAVRFGLRGTRAFYLALLLVAAAVPPLGMAIWGWDPWTLLALLGLGLALRPIEAVFSFHDPRELLPALGGTARVVTWYAGLLAAGFVLGG
ncbi:MAG: 1,4-dihydroxy-2-naphthoate polyprenyltransferase [Gemmatimonadales bacterium]|nr:MAG: 1,4-dihydroxy-2-naphthoate polyprenyltransferase [Gemmatimonadales bacterium]